MLRFEDIMSKEFAEANPKHVVDLISRHHLLEPIQKTIDLINFHLSEKENEIKSRGTIQVSHLASSLLIRINEHLRGLKAKRRKKDKEELEYYLGNLLKRLLQEITILLPQDAKIKFSVEIYVALKDTCELYGYDFPELMKFLGILSTARELHVGTQTPAVVPSIERNALQIPCYNWNGTHEQRVAFLQMVKRHKISKEHKKIEQLFCNPAKNLAIKLDESRAGFVLHFLACVNESKFITPVAAGFYQVLECHACNFSQAFLKGLSAQRAVGNAKKKSNWKNNMKIFNTELKAIVEMASSRTTSKPTSRPSSPDTLGATGTG
jgi:hypothetical protein